ncbi:MAG TPA: GlsB/YeaQ/YmgE family stress response membrane protein [Deltaproteobacteria bacterium]|nr:GlsB/YeaQ/YmgE family stress response membrane protein [Deltaproteobacteria bacterium]HOI06801.1 GlsB/YeaQ/YmgE family stress response membrane protein [Deltaproteobacteria bacterium]
MGILSWIIIGLIAGWLAGVIMRGSGYGILGDIGLGILGALVGGFLAGAIFGVPVAGFNLVTLLIALLGAILVVAVARAVSGRARARHL